MEAGPVGNRILTEFCFSMEQSIKEIQLTMSVAR